MWHQIVIVGNLGRDPEMRYIPSGTAVTTFSVATSHQYTNASGEKIKTTTWFRVSAWGKNAENCAQYLKKGSKVLVTGRLVSGPDGTPKLFQKQDGSMGSSYEVSADTVRFLSPKDETSGQSHSHTDEDAGMQGGGSSEDETF